LTDPAVPTTHRLADLTISQVAGVDWPAHLQDGWAVIKAAGAAPALAEVIETERPGLAARFAKATSVGDLDDDDQATIAALIDRIIDILGEDTDEDTDDTKKVPTTKAAASADPPNPGAEPKEVGLTDTIDKAALPEPVRLHIDKLEKAAADATSERDAAKAETETVKADLAKAKAEPAGEDDFLKSLSPGAREAFQKQAERLEKAESMAKAERDHRIDQEFLAKAANVTVPGDRAQIAKAMRTIDELGGDVAETFTRILRYADEMAHQAGITKMVGYDGGDDSSDPQSKLETLAKTRAEKNGEPYAKAYTAVLDTPEGQSLYAELDKRSA
jgi:hypothetical protein